MDGTSDNPIYLDYNATSPVMPEAMDAMLPYLRREFGNPSSTHRYGRSARRAVDRARRQVAELIGASPSEIIFTSGGTESNNLAIFGAVEVAESAANIVTTGIEHPAVSAVCDHLADSGLGVERIGVDGNCSIEVDAAIDAIDGDTALVTMMHSNNETGVIQPVESVFEHARRQGVVVHSDASQSVGKVPIDVGSEDIDLLTIAGHKLYAPKGVGALYVREGVEIAPLMRGADHEEGLRPGTENVAAIVALGKACEVIASRGDSERRRIAGLRDLLEARLRAGIDGLKVNGDRERRLPNTLNIRFPDVRGVELMAHAPGINASTGSACKAGATAPSPVLKAMGLEDREALASLRLSLGCDNDSEQIERAATLLIDAWREASR